MAVSNIARRAARGLAFSAAIVATLGLATARPAQALGTGAAVGIGLGALAVGTAIGASQNPYYAPAPAYAYPPAYGYAPAYYPPGPAHSCWSPYYGRYYPC